MNATHERHFAAAAVSACGSGDVEFLRRWARADAEGFASCLGAKCNGADALMRAIQCDQPECALFMLQHVDANAATSEGQRPISEATNQGHLRVMRILLDHGADPNLADQTPPLVLAAFNGFREAVLLLLERGAHVNLLVTRSRTALSAATTSGHLEIMRDLFAAGADPNIGDERGYSPFYMAVSLRQPEAAELLLEWGADVMFTPTPADGGKNALMLAAREGYAHLVTKILAKAAEAEAEGEGEAFVNARASNGATALMMACQKGSEAAVQVLLQHPRIEIDVLNDRHNSAVMIAAMYGHAGIVEALLARGASVKPDARATTSVLIQACAHGMRGLVKSILERGGEDACVDFQGHQSSTALMWACDRNFPEIAEMLLQAGADVNALNTYGFTPLMCAAKSESGPEIARLLLERGADPNVHRPDRSPLILACTRSAPEFGAVCQALIRAGADVNAKNSKGATPLQVAIDNNNKAAVKALLNSGARVHADNVQRQLVDYIYELKSELEAVVQVFPQALASARMRKACRNSPEEQ